MSIASVVILNYNGKTFLEKFLGKVVEFSAPHRVIVADNASTDDSIEYLEKNFSNVGIIRIPKNEGFAGGYNVALSQIDSPYFVLINSDVEVREGWLNPLVKFLDNNNEYAACQPKIKAHHDKKLFEYAGAAGGFIDSLGYPYCRGRLFDELEEDNGQYDSTIDIFWASGACMIIRKSLFQAAGGFDEDFFAHMEEIDLCWRLRRMGHKIACVHESEVYHVGGGTLSKSNPKKPT